MAHEDPLWIARRDGQDWRDDEVQAAVDWLGGLAPAAEMAERIEAQRRGLDAALAVWRDGGQAPPTDGRDQAAWWLLQGADFAQGRRHTVPEEAARITPLLKRLGADLAVLRAIPGAEVRAARLLTERRTSMDPESMNCSWRSLGGGTDGRSSSSRNNAAGPPPPTSSRPARRAVGRSSASVWNGRCTR